MAVGHPPAEDAGWPVNHASSLAHMTRLRGRHVVVTGGSKGIGAAVARRAALAGAQVSLIARGESDLRATAASIGPAATWQTGDVTDESIAQVLHEVQGRVGPCDVLVCCAGIALPGRFLDVPSSEFDQQWAVNVRGSILCIKAVLPQMVQRRSGHLVLVSSTAGVLGVPGYTGYAATKFAIRGLADSLRYEVERHHVRVTVLFPPDTDTPGFAAENLRKPPETAAISARIKPQPADDVARALIRGIERDQRVVTVDAATRTFLRFGGLLDPAVRWSFQRTVERVTGGEKPAI